MYYVSNVLVVKDPKKINRYGVYEREFIIKEVRSDRGDLEGVITRARDGFEVLNTSKHCCPVKYFLDSTKSRATNRIGWVVPKNDLN